MATKVFFDTNIILDLFDDKRPFHSESIALYKLIEDGIFHAFVSESVLTTTDYILQKKMSKKDRLLLFEELLDFLKILPSNNLIFNKALKSNFDDFEDAILYQIALENRLNYFITNDTAAIKKLSSPLLQIIKPKDLLKLLG